MRRHPGKLLTPRPSPFAAWTAFVRRTVERFGSVKVAVVPGTEAPKPRPRRKAGISPKSRRHPK